MREETTASVRGLAQETRTFLKTQKVHEALPETSRVRFAVFYAEIWLQLLVLDDKVSLSVAIRSLEQYSKRVAG